MKKKPAVTREDYAGGQGEGIGIEGRAPKSTALKTSGLQTNKLQPSSGLGPQPKKRAGKTWGPVRDGDKIVSEWGQTWEIREEK